jgi:hypothetical protein
MCDVLTKRSSRVHSSTAKLNTRMNRVDMSTQFTSEQSSQVNCVAS